MTWIVLGEEKGKVLLATRKDKDNIGILHNGSYLTIKENEEGIKRKFILRVEETYQDNPLQPISPLIINMNLGPLLEEQQCHNVVYASRIIEFPERYDGRSSFIKQYSEASRSNQEEIDLAFGNTKGIPIFPATAFARNCQLLRDDNGKAIQVKIPEEVFFYQILVTGRTGSGKTVGMKYLAQYFLENFEDGLGGAVLAVNVKEEDFLIMDKQSTTANTKILKEWSDLNVSSHGVETSKIYCPGKKILQYSKAIDLKKCDKITLKTKNVDPDTLVGLTQNISTLGADQLPSIFRHWQQRIMEEGDNLMAFIRYFSDPEKERQFETLTSTGEEGAPVKMFAATHQNVINALTVTAEYFDVDGAKELQADDILQRGKFSVIDVVSKGGFGFGSVLLRDLLDKIYEANSKKDKDERVPVLIIIDEVHEFYGSARSKEALQALDLICRKGRILKIGVIFASQNLEDMPPGISKVVNSKIQFKSDLSSMKSIGINIQGFDPESFEAGYAVTRIHGLNQLKLAKFPMSLAGVNDETK